MLVDIGANLTDLQYNGFYNGKNVASHPADLDTVLQRASINGVTNIIVTGGSYDESVAAIQLCRTATGHIPKLSCTVGCHPTRCNEVDQYGGEVLYEKKLSQLIEANREWIVAVGECGLDSDRTHFCDFHIQKKYFPLHFRLAAQFQLPLFLHDRNTKGEFASMIKQYAHLIPTCSARTTEDAVEIDADPPLLQAVVHSFTGTIDELHEYLSLGLFIGVNGCSLKTKENLSAVAQIPLSRLLLETDSPWCDIRSTHSSFVHVQTHFPTMKKEKYCKNSMVKGRNEPCALIQVLEVVHALQVQKGIRITIEELKGILYKNSLRLFKLL